MCQTPLIGLHIAADVLIAIAYYSILVALISLYTALSLIPVIPAVIQFPFPQDLEKLNKQLTEQIFATGIATEKVYQLNQDLEQRVKEKTSTLVRANQDLQESTIFREKLTDLTPNILYIFDVKTNRNIYCNPFITELLGYTSVELQKFQNGLFDELIHPENLELLKQHFDSCLSLEEDKYLEVEYRIKNTHGEWCWLHDKNAIFSRNAQGEPEQILGIAQDITQTKRIQFETKKLNQKREGKIAVLEARDKSRIQLAQMNEFIQACLSLNEAQGVIGDLLQPLFPNSAGAVYLMNNSKNILDAIATWGNSRGEDHFDPKECWGIRRGNSHQALPPMLQNYIALI